MNNDTTAKNSEKLVNAIMKEDNVYAQDVLSKILAKKVDKRYDEVIKN